MGPSENPSGHPNEEKCVATAVVWRNKKVTKSRVGIRKLKHDLYHIM